VLTRNASDFSHARAIVRTGVSLQAKIMLEWGDKMDRFISKAWPNNTLHDIAERMVILSVLLVVVVAVLRVLGIVR
jgi:hypothetical protein